MNGIFDGMISSDGESMNMSDKPLVFYIEYADGKVKKFPFKSLKEARQFFHNEGDHAYNWWVDDK